MALSPQEKIEMTGKIIHGMQCDPDIFDEVKQLIWVAETKGLYKGVTINPSTEPSKNNQP